MRLQITYDQLEMWLRLIIWQGVVIHTCAHTHIHIHAYTHIATYTYTLYIHAGAPMYQ